MSKLAIVRDEKFRDHLTPELHPESPQRLVSIDKELKRTHLIDEVSSIPARLASEDELAAIHQASYIEHLQSDSKEAIRTSTIVHLDEDTFMSPDTYETAKLAAGAGLVAVDSVGKDDFQSAFVIVRPPGHHALADRAMGFCVFNNLAVAARYAQDSLGVKRILVVDWDVHHGNGTQDLFYSDPSVCFISFHQYPFWPPETGWYTEVGAGEGKGYNINIPLPAGTGDRGYLKAWDAVVDPVCREYEPELIMLSAGYDAHQFDPLGQQQVSTPGYVLLSQRLNALAKDGGSKLVGFLEGGYNTRTLSESLVATLRELNNGGGGKTQGQSVPEIKPVTGDRNPALVDERINDLRQFLSSYWKALR